MDPVGGRGGAEHLGMLGRRHLHDALLEELEQPGSVARRPFVGAGHVHDPVEGDAGVHRGVRPLEARLERRVAGGERQQGREVPPGGAPLTATKEGSPPYCRDVRLDPGHGPLGVDDLRRPGRPGTEPVVDGDAHPTPGDELVQHRLALLALLPHHPRPAVDVHHDRRVGGRGQARPVDVETVTAVPVAPVVDVLRGQHRATLERNGSGHPPEADPSRGPPPRREPGSPAAHLGQGGVHHHGRPAGRRRPGRPGRPSCTPRWPNRANRPNP